MMNLSRRDFVKYSLMATGAMNLPSVSGCALPKKNVPQFRREKPFLLDNVHVIDVVTGKVTRHAKVLLDSAGRIHEIRTDAPEFSAGYRILNMKGRYLIPGLIDAHCHSTATSAFRMKTMEIGKHIHQQKMNYVNTIESGVTTIRDMGAFPGLLQRFMYLMDLGDIPGPRVIYCNSMLNVKGGHPEIPPSDVNIFAEPVSWFVGMMMNNFENDRDMMACLHDNAKGASFVKLTLDDKSLFCKKDPKIPVYTSRQMDTIFDFAEKLGLPVVGHHQFKFGFDRAMQYPFHSIEHIVTDEVLTDEEVLLMAERKVSIVPTLTLAQSFMVKNAYKNEIPQRLRSETVDREMAEREHYMEHEAFLHVDPVFHTDNLAMLDYYRRFPIESLFMHKKFLVDPEIYFNMANHGFTNLKKMKDAGVLIGTGIDAGMPFHYFGSLYREFEIFQRLGFTPLEILRCATINSAKILRIDENTGNLEAGKWADMVAYRENPLENVRVLRSPEMVFKEGEMMFAACDLAEDGTLGV